MEKSFSNFKKNILLENANSSWLLDIINSRGLVRSNTTREKYIGYLKMLDDSASIDKKMLTKITNDFSTLCANYYGNLDEIITHTVTFGRNYTEQVTEKKSRAELRNLITQRGYTIEYDIKEADPYYNCYHFLKILHIYDIYDPARIIIAIEKYKHIMNQAELDWFNQYYQNLDKWVDLLNKLKVIERLLKPTKEEKSQKKLDEIKKTYINPQIREAVDQISENFRIVIEKNEYDYYLSVASVVATKYPDGITMENFFKICRNTDLLRKMCSYKNESDKFYLLPNYADLLKPVAFDRSVNVIAPFTYKMYDKLSGFLTELNKEFDVSVLGKNKNNNEIIFNFTDKSAFTIKNSVVSKFSNRGTFFYTYPTTFHSAYLPNREKIPNPNEYSVKKAFLDYEARKK